MGGKWFPGPRELVVSKLVSFQTWNWQQNGGLEPDRSNKTFCVPEANVVPTPFRLDRLAMACSIFGSFRKAFLVSVWTAFGVLIRTRLVSCGKNLPRWRKISKSKSQKELARCQSLMISMSFTLDKGCIRSQTNVSVFSNYFPKVFLGVKLKDSYEGRPK